MKTLSDYSLEEIIKELIKREKTDNMLELKLETSSSYTFKFYKKT